MVMESKIHSSSRKFHMGSSLCLLLSKTGPELSPSPLSSLRILSLILWEKSESIVQTPPLTNMTKKITSFPLPQETRILNSAISMVTTLLLVSQPIVMALPRHLGLYSMQADVLSTKRTGTETARKPITMKREMPSRLKNTTKLTRLWLRSLEQNTTKRETRPNSKGLCVIKTATILKKKLFTFQVPTSFHLSSILVARSWYMAMISTPAL